MVTIEIKTPLIQDSEIVHCHFIFLLNTFSAKLLTYELIYFAEVFDHTYINDITSIFRFSKLCT